MRRFCQTRPRVDEVTRHCNPTRVSAPERHIPLLTVILLSLHHVRRRLERLAAHRVRSRRLHVRRRSSVPPRRPYPRARSELLKTLGVPLVVDDLYSLDPAALHDFAPVRALIFLFKWLPSGPTPTPAQGGTPAHDFPGFFAQQVVANACATLAVLNAVANIPRLRTGPDLAALLDFTLGMDALTRGLALTSADWLRAAHNALSPPAAVSLDGLGLPKGKAEDAYHFVVYVPVGGRVYELDGLRDAPLDHGAFVDRGEGWLAIARCVAALPLPLARTPR